MLNVFMCAGMWEGVDSLKNKQKNISQDRSQCYEGSGTTLGEGSQEPQHEDHCILSKDKYCIVTVLL